MKVNLSPSRKPGFQWLGIQGICLHQDDQNPNAIARQHSKDDALPAISGDISEAASSTAEGHSCSQPQLQRESSCQLGNTLLRSQSPPVSSKGTKRSAAYSQPSTAPNKRSRTQSEPLSALANIHTGASAGQSANPPELEQALSASAAEICSSMFEPARPESSPGLPEKRSAEGQTKAGLRPTPVPTTPDGAQPDALHLQRQKVSLQHSMVVSVHFAMTHRSVLRCKQRKLQLHTSGCQGSHCHLQLHYGITWPCMRT